MLKGFETVAVDMHFEAPRTIEQSIDNGNWRRALINFVFSLASHWTDIVSVTKYTCCKITESRLPLTSNGRWPSRRSTDDQMWDVHIQQRCQQWANWIALKRLAVWPRVDMLHNALSTGIAIPTDGVMALQGLSDCWLEHLSGLNEWQSHKH